MKYLYIFLLGGTLLAGSRYLADQIHSPSLSASMALFPMSIIVGMFITKKKEFKMYCLNIIAVTIFGLITWLLIYYYIENYKFDIKYIIILGLPLFFLFQYGRYCLCDFIYPQMNLLTK